MEIVVTPGAQAASQLAARLMARRLRDKPALVMGLATGRTMERVYAALLGEIALQRLSCEACQTFNLDEYCDLSATDPRSYRSFMDVHLFEPAGIARARTNFPGEAGATGEEYEARIRRAGGIDLQLLGIGENGHIGFNEPLSSFSSRTRQAVLAQATRRQNAGMFDGDASAVPASAMTMGIATIMEAREIVLLATGEAKAAIVARALEGPISAIIPATVLHWHPNCHVILDEGAASGLTRRVDYDWTVRHSPIWGDLVMAAAL